MNLYLASNYSSHPRMRLIAERLRSFGHDVTCEWISGTHQADDHQDYARIDLRDIEAADALVLFSEDTLGSRTRGGKHVEFGYALAKGKALFLIGERRNVFHYLPEVSTFADETSFIAAISGLSVCPTCGEPAEFTEHSETVTGSLGLSFDEDWGMDRHEEEWLTCDRCGAQTDQKELSRLEDSEVIS